MVTPASGVSPRGGPVGRWGGGGGRGADVPPNGGGGAPPLRPARGVSARVAFPRVRSAGTVT